MTEREDLEDALREVLDQAVWVDLHDGGQGLLDETEGLVWAVEGGESEEGEVRVKAGEVEGPGLEPETVRVQWSGKGYVDGLAGVVAGPKAGVAAAVEEARKALA